MFRTKQQAKSNTTSINNGYYIYNILLALNVVQYLYWEVLEIVLPDWVVADIWGREAGSVFAASSRFMLSSRGQYLVSDSWSCLVRRMCLLFHLMIFPLHNLILLEWQGRALLTIPSLFHKLSCNTLTFTLCWRHESSLGLLNLW